MRAVRIALVGAAIIVLATGVHATDTGRPLNELGPANAPVTVVEYCSYDLDACARLDVIINGVLRDYSDRVRLIFHHVETDRTSAASSRFRAALAAGVQGQFWQMHTVLMANRDRAAVADVHAMAAQLGLDTERFARDITGSTIVETAARDAAEAAAHSVTALPGLFVNDRAVSVQSAKELRAAIDMALHR